MVEALSVGTKETSWEREKTHSFPAVEMISVRGEKQARRKEWKAAALTLRSDGVGDRTGVAEAESVRRSDHKQVDGRGLQVL